MADNESLPIIFGGLDRSEVDAAVNQLRSEMDELRRSNETLRADIEATENQIVLNKTRSSDLESKVDRLPEKMNYSALGPQFEEVLRLAEEKSGRLVTDARSEAQKLRVSAEARAAEQLRESEERAAEIVREAEMRSKEMRLSSETTATNLIASASIRLAEATERVAEARREAEAILNRARQEGEASRAKYAADSQAETEALADLAAETQRAREAFERQIAQRQEQFEIESARRQQEAVELSARLLEEAQNKASEISESAREISEESDSLQSASYLRAEEMLAEARRIAGGVLNQAQQRTGLVSDLTHEYSEGLLERSNQRAELLNEERESINVFLSDVVDTRATDRLLSALESDISPSDFMPRDEEDFQQ